MENSKTYQYRKVMKPMLERKRRARINKCLDELKDIMVECLTQEGEHVTRLEKADILELTVEHMKKLKKRGSLALATKPSETDCFRSGYVHAADQISHVLAATPGVGVDLGSRLMSFLGQRLLDLQNATDKPKPVHYQHCGHYMEGARILQYNTNEVRISPVWRPW